MSSHHRATSSRIFLILLPRRAFTSTSIHLYFVHRVRKSTTSTLPPDTLPRPAGLATATTSRASSFVALRPPARRRATCEPPSFSTIPSRTTRFAHHGSSRRAGSGHGREVPGGHEECGQFRRQAAVPGLQGPRRDPETGRYTTAEGELKWLIVDSRTHGQCWSRSWKQAQTRLCVSEQSTPCISRLSQRPVPHCFTRLTP